jgi:hypothetical protein
MAHPKGNGFMASELKKGGQTPDPDDDATPPHEDSNIERQLDRALEETFPASDPVSITTG